MTDPSFQDANTASSVIESTNAKLKIINTNLEYPKAIPLVKSILSNKTPDIRITEMTFTSVNSSSVTLSFSGIAGSRESLITYANLLKESKMFSKIDLPISNLAKNKDINFSMTLSASK